MSNQIRLKRGSGSDPSASDLVVGEVALRTDNGKLFTKKDDNSITEIGSGISDGDKGDITISNSGGTFTIDNGAITSAKILDGTIVGSDLATNVDFIDNQSLRFGTGNDLLIKHNGTNAIFQNTSGDIKFATTGVLRLRGDDIVLSDKDQVESYIVCTKNSDVELYFDNVVKLKTHTSGVSIIGSVFADSLDMGDNDKILLGASDDLQIYHDGNHSFVENTTGFLILQDTSNIRLRSDDLRFESAGGSETYATLTKDGAVALNFDASQKFTTTANGVNIESGSPNLQVLANTDGENAKLTLIGRTAAGGVGTAAICRIEAESKQSSNSASEMKFKTRTTGNVITTALTIDENQHINLPIDNQKLKLGASSDLEIFHNGFNSKIADVGTGALILSGSTVKIENGASSENQAVFNENGSVELYHDNIKKLETYSDGIKVIGQEGTSAALQLVADDGDDNGDTWELRSNQDDNDLTFKNNISGSSVDKLTLQNDGDLFTTGDVYLKNDSKKLKFGASSDLEIFHDGTNARFHNTTGLTSMRASGYRFNNSLGIENCLDIDANGAVSLYFDHSKKLETTSAGATVTGSLGIGATPLRKLHIADTGDVALMLQTTNANNDAEIFEIGCGANSSSNADLVFRTRLNSGSGGSEVFRLTNDGNVQISNDTGKLQLGASQDLQIYHDGTHSYVDNTSGSGNLYLKDEIVRVRAATSFAVDNADGTETSLMATLNGSVELYEDGVKKAETTADGFNVEGTLHANEIDMDDNHKILLGLGDDLEIFHTGTASKINNATGSLFLQSDAMSFHGEGGSETMAVFAKNGAVELYHDNNKKFETTANGVKVPDAVRIAVGDSEDAFFYHNGAGSDGAISNTVGNFLIYGGGGQIYLRPVNTENALIAKPNEGVELYYDASKKFETHSAGVLISGNAYLNDNNKFIAGTHNDIQIFHDGSNNQINYSNGNLLIRQGSHSSSECLQFDSNGHLFVPDNELIYFGSGADLQIFHDGSNSFIRNSTGGLDLNSDTIHLRNGANNETYARFLANGAAELYFDNVERLKTKSNGIEITGFLSATSSSGSVAQFIHGSSGDTVGCVMRHGRGGLSGFSGKMISFRGNDNTEEGSIVIGTTTTAYNTSSDYRLKENETSILSPITKLKTLKPYTFNFKKDPGVKVDGFFAHEVSSVVPVAVTGIKDEVDKNSNPVYQGIDQSKLVPLITAALQEAIAKIEVLETEVASLKAS